MFVPMEFIELPLFARSVAGLLDEAALLEVQVYLLLQPDAGDLMPGSGGLRKLRWAAKGKGKRGGSRLIYYWAVSEHLIYLVVAYAKNDLADLTPKQARQLRELIGD